MSEVILLDTHIWLWLINGNFEKFPSQWLDKIESADRVGVSPLSCYEIALAHDKGRIILSLTAQDSALEYDAKLASVDSLFPKYAELTDHLMM